MTSDTEIVVLFVETVAWSQVTPTDGYNACTEEHKNILQEYHCRSNPLCVIVRVFPVDSDMFFEASESQGPYGTLGDC